MEITDLRAKVDDDDRDRFTFRLDGRLVWTFAQERPNLLEEGVAVFSPPLSPGEGLQLERPDAAPTFFPGATRDPILVALMRRILAYCADPDAKPGPIDFKGTA